MNNTITKPLNQNKMKQTAVEFLEKEITEIMSYLEEDGAYAMQGVKDKLFGEKNIIQQAKEMEKKQNIGFAEFVASYTDKNKNVNGEMLHAKSKYDGAERTVDLLEIYTKK